jgi:hypothetical protein
LNQLAAAADVSVDAMMLKREVTVWPKLRMIAIAASEMNASNNEYSKGPGPRFRAKAGPARVENLASNSSTYTSWQRDRTMPLPIYRGK